MQQIQKNYPLVVAWLSYIISAWLLKTLPEVGMFWLYKRFSFELSSNSYLLIGIVILIAAEYTSYASSVRWVAVPLSLLAKQLSTKPKPDFLVLDWLSFCYYFGLFCLPLLAVNAFPFISFDVKGLPISKEVAYAIGFAWKPIVSLFAYRSTVLSYLHDMTNEHSSTSESQATV